VPAGVPVANAADAHAESGAAGLSGSATTITQGSDFAADNSGLKLVFAEVGTDPQVGSGAARASGQKVELLALPASLAADVITNGTGAVSSTVLAAGRQAADDIFGDLNQASASPLVAAAPTPLDVLQLPLQTLWAIGAGVNVPVSPLIPAPYTSVLKVVSDAIQVAILPLTIANLALYGQIAKIPDTITKTINTAATSLFVGLPASIAGTLQYDVSVVHQFLGGLGAPAAPNAAPTTVSPQAKSAAVDPSPTLHEEHKGAEIAAAADVTDSGGETKVTAETDEDATAGGKTNTATADATATGESKKPSTDSTTDGTTTTGTTGTSTGGATGTAGDEKNDTESGGAGDTKPGGAGDAKKDSTSGDADGGTSTKADNTAK